MIQTYIETLKKFNVFSGRASRREYWTFVLGNMVLGFTVGVLEGIMGNQTNGMLANLLNLVVLLPSIAVLVRRMHDVNKSGWFGIIPIYNLVLALTQGTSGPNNYGEQPASQASAPKQTTQTQA